MPEQLEIKNLKLDTENQPWNLFPMKFKSPSGETILRIVSEDEMYSGSARIEADEEIGAALRRWVHENNK